MLIIIIFRTTTSMEQLIAQPPLQPGGNHNPVIIDSKDFGGSFGEPKPVRRQHNWPSTHAKIQNDFLPLKTWKFQLIDQFTDQQCTPVTKLRYEIAKLVSRVSLRDGVRIEGKGVPGKKVFDNFGRKLLTIDTKFICQPSIELQPLHGTLGTHAHEFLRNVLPENPDTQLEDPNAGIEKNKT